MYLGEEKPIVYNSLGRQRQWGFETRLCFFAFILSKLEDFIYEESSIAMYFNWFATVICITHNGKSTNSSDLSSFLIYFIRHMEL